MVASILWVFFSLLIASIFVIFNEHSVRHLSRSRYNKPWGYGNYKKFIKYFYQYDWTITYDYADKLLVDDNNDCIINPKNYYIKFNGVDFIVRNPFSMYLIIIFIKKFVSNKQFERKRSTDFDDVFNEKSLVDIAFLEKMGSDKPRIENK